MPDVLVVDRLEVLVLMDNLTDSLSTNPGNVTVEWTGLMTGGRMRMMSGQAPTAMARVFGDELVPSAGWKRYRIWRARP